LAAAEDQRGDHRQDRDTGSHGAPSRQPRVWCGLARDPHADAGAKLRRRLNGQKRGELAI